MFDNSSKFNLPSYINVLCFKPIIYDYCRNFKNTLHITISFMKIFCYNNVMLFNKYKHV